MSQAESTPLCQHVVAVMSHRVPKLFPQLVGKGKLQDEWFKNHGAEVSACATPQQDVFARQAAQMEMRFETAYTEEAQGVRWSARLAEFRQMRRQPRQDTSKDHIETTFDPSSPTRLVQSSQQYSLSSSCP